MKIVFLTEEYLEPYVDYCREALSSDESEDLVFDHVCEEEVVKFLTDPFYQNTKNLLAVENGKVIGQLEYHFYGVLADHYRMAYVDWIHTLKSYRKQGVARALFARFEEECCKQRINQYYLIQAENAKGFYDKFGEASSSTELILRKNICD